MGDRHVLLQWQNGHIPTQALLLRSFNSAVCPEVMPLSQSTRQFKNFPLGNFTREQRERILVLANEVLFKKTSTLNSLSHLDQGPLEMMVKEGLVLKSVFEEIDIKVPLLRRELEI